jgi:hypothetical protein
MSGSEYRAWIFFQPESGSRGQKEPDPGSATLPKISVPDPLHFGVDPDPDPRIHASE